MPGLPIRGDLSPEELRQRARREDDGRVSRRLLAIANALDGMSREMAARAACMTGRRCATGLPVTIWAG
jgi:hypothetical protein